MPPSVRKKRKINLGFLSSGKSEESSRIKIGFTHTVKAREWREHLLSTYYVQGSEGLPTSGCYMVVRKGGPPGADGATATHKGVTSSGLTLGRLTGTLGLPTATPLGQGKSDGQFWEDGGSNSF